MSIHSLAAALLLIPAIVSVACADEAVETTEAAEGVLVLKNGRIVRGRISGEKDHFLVKRDERTEFRIARHDVDFRTDSLDSAYHRKRSRLQKGSAAVEHLRLADWCLRCGLRTAAMDEVLTAMSKGGETPRIKYYLRRIQQTPRQPVQRAAHLTADTKRTAKTPQQLLQLVRSLPDNAMEQFTAQIQPLLVNRCGAANCHGLNTETHFRLIRPTVGRTYSQRFSQRNLASVMEYVEVREVEKSEILKRSVEAHGGQALPTFDKKDLRQFELLVEWVRSVARDALPAQPRQLAKPAAIYSQPAVGGFRRPEARRKPAEEKPAADPFDPTEFNRSGSK